MKTCSKCNQSKNIEYFTKCIKTNDGLFAWCKNCQRIYTNKWRTTRIKWLQELKSNTPCVDCNQIYEPYCMDYDHLPNQDKKINSITKMIMDNTSKENILKEIKKCDLVCIMCHQKRTHIRFNDKFGADRKYKSHELRNINIIDEFKRKPCTICNIQYEPYNMQIDHIDPSNKLYDVCQLKSRKEKILQDELAKCQVLCALCHRRKSITEQQDNKYSAARPKPPKRQELFYDPISNIKECRQCHEIKDGILFLPNKNTTSRLNSYCRKCSNKYQREWSS